MKNCDRVEYNVTALAGKATGTNTGLSITLGPEVTLHGGTFTGVGGTYAYGIWVAGGSSTFLGAADVRASGVDASNTNAGLDNGNYPTVLLQGGFFLGSGGQYAYGIYNHDAAHLEAEGVTAQGENAETARALYNYTDSRATLRGGSFTARTSVTGGVAYAIHNAGGANTILEAYDVTALAEGTVYSQGLRNEAAGTVARVNGGTFTARGGSMTAIGISTWGNLTAQGTFALAENGTVGNYGLYASGDQARADACRFKGSTYAVREVSGALYLAVSQLDGGMQRTAGTVTCFQVYNGNYAAYSCP